MNRDYSRQRGYGATRCYGCLCDTCANSVELPSWNTTIGEAEVSCFSCDECRHYDGNQEKPDQWRDTCPRYIEAKKAAHARVRAAERRAKAEKSKQAKLFRATFKVIEGGKAL